MQDDWSYHCKETSGDVVNWCRSLEEYHDPVSFKMSWCLYLPLSQTNSHSPPFSRVPYTLLSLFLSLEEYHDPVSFKMSWCLYLPLSQTNSHSPPFSRVPYTLLSLFLSLEEYHDPISFKIFCCLYLPLSLTLSPSLHYFPSSPLHYSPSFSDLKNIMIPFPLRCLDVCILHYSPTNPTLHYSPSPHYSLIEPPHQYPSYRLWTTCCPALLVPTSTTSIKC